MDPYVACERNDGYRGRATIAALGMNRPALLAIRQELVRVRKFPPILIRGIED